MKLRDINALNKVIVDLYEASISVEESAGTLSRMDKETPELRELANKMTEIADKLLHETQKEYKLAEK